MSLRDRDHANRSDLQSPVISPASWRTLMNWSAQAFAHHVSQAEVRPLDMPLLEAVRAICEQAESGGT